MEIEQNAHPLILHWCEKDCAVLLLHGKKGCYLPSPYVDDHGERHGHYRGRPLYLDPTRWEVLRKMVASNEVSSTAGSLRTCTLALQSTLVNLSRCKS